MTGIHGGDIYRNRVKLDFSINVNPLGIPDAVRHALRDAVMMCGAYPDPEAEALREAVAAMLAVPEETLLFGNGASELFVAIMHGIRPKRTVIPVPSFYGYEYAAGTVDGEIIYYEMIREDGLYLTEDFYSVLTKDVEVLILANPNNPTGNLMSRETVIRILEYCKERGIYVVLDECFIEFCGRETSMIPETARFDNLIIIRAFTKSFSIPGVRLGYLVCSDDALRRRIKRQLPEWNLSVFAQEAGRVCAGQTDFIAKTESYVRKEREYLVKGLRKLGYTVYPSEANFILLYCEEVLCGKWKEEPHEKLYDKLLAKGILIRDCENFRGLGRGYYRIAVKSREENDILLNMIATGI
ncbi:MAG: aminotransferase class I/II-fold pyridoxal phosphate-dependent enzyme [Lachnospiraceae bacterium]|nr:aminotransferase class I/II-fold pyridoxal phosphate-dependent enzyme [Lachnospiraceae bacterium]